MRSSRRKWSRAAVVSAALAALAAAAGYDYVAARRSSAPPARFALWKMQPGGPFAALEQQLWLEQRRAFECRPLVGRNQVCATRSSGQPTTATPGSLRVLVDSVGTVAAVQFRAEIDSSRVRLQAREMERTWRHDLDTLMTRWDGLAPVADRGQGDGGQRLWRDERRTSSAWLRRDQYTRFAPTLTVADERALEGVRRGADLAAVVLDREALDYASANAEGKLEHTALLGPAAERRDVPVCPPQYRHAREGAGARQNHSERWLALLERSIPLAYPGTTLHVGDGLSLMRDGVPERLVADPSTDTREGPVAVYAIHLPDREGIAGVREQRGRAAACRVPAELLLVQLDRAGAPLETYRLLLDGEATLARVDAVEVIGPHEGGPGVHVEYTAAYDTPEWYAHVVWSARVQLNEPRVHSRVPAVVTKKLKATGEERRALTVVRGGAPADSVRVSFLEPTPTTKTVVIGHRPGQALDAYALLEKF